MIHNEKREPRYHAMWNCLWDNWEQKKIEYGIAILGHDCSFERPEKFTYPFEKNEISIGEVLADIKKQGEREAKILSELLANLERNYTNISIATKMESAESFTKSREGNKMTEALLPCPFCGFPPKYLYLDLPDSTRWAVKCQGCETRTAFLSEKLEVISKWNRRHTSTPESKKAKFQVGQKVYLLEKREYSQEGHKSVIYQLSDVYIADGAQENLQDKFMYKLSTRNSKVLLPSYEVEENLFATFEEAKAELTRKIEGLKEEAE